MSEMVKTNVEDKRYFVVSDGNAISEIITQNEIMDLLVKFEERKNTSFKYIEKFLKGERITKRDKLKIAVELLKANNEVGDHGLVFTLNEIVSDFGESIQLKDIVISLKDFLKQKMFEQDKLHIENPEDEETAANTIYSFIKYESGYYSITTEDASHFLHYVADFHGSTDYPEISFNLLSEEERNEMSLFDVIDSILISARGNGIMQ
ncbi:MAG: hypothetical protein KBF93_02400 [Leptospiraceae bacterium]|nr:hypothetical protein [Leptospiraceae bacterium]